MKKTKERKHIQNDTVYTIFHLHFMLDGLALIKLVFTLNYFV